MALASVGRRQTALLLASAAARPTCAAASFSLLSLPPPDSSSSAAAADPYWGRRTSHSAASTSAAAYHPPSPGRPSLRRHYSASPAPAPTGDFRPKRTPRHMNDDSIPLPPPGAALRRATRPSIALWRNNSSPPPWQEAPQEHLKQQLQEYKEDLVLAKPPGSVRRTRRSRKSELLPFLEDAVTGVVHAERTVLAASLATRERDPFSSAGSSSAAAAFYSKQQLSQRPSAAAAAAMLSARQSSQATAALSDDDAQAALASQANEVIGVLTAVERHLPLTKRQASEVARAVVRSMHDAEAVQREKLASAAAAAAPPPPPPVRSPLGNTAGMAEEPTQTLPQARLPCITASSARNAVKFLLSDCDLTHRLAADAVCDHPWLLTIAHPGAECGAVLESFKLLLGMPPAALAAIVAAHPATLLLDVERDVLPLLGYLSSLEFTDAQITEMLNRAPGVLLERGAKDQLAGSVAFWVGRNMSRQALQRMLLAVPEVAGMGLRLMQIKVDWLADHAGFSSAEDFAAVPEALAVPLATVAAPRLAFARSLGVPVAPPRQTSSQSAAATAAHIGGNQLTIAELLAGSDAAYLERVGASVEDYRAFVATWRDAELRQWLLDRFAGDAVAQYEGMDWLASETMAELREVHDRHVVMREMAWEQQKEREKEWNTVWLRWRKEQMRREQVQQGVRRVQKQREQEALRRATAELAMIMESKKGREPGLCEKSPFCNRPALHTGICNSKLSFDMDPVTLAAMTGPYATVSRALEVSQLGEKRINISGTDNFLEEEGTRSQTVNEAATWAELVSGIALELAGPMEKATKVLSPDQYRVEPEETVAKTVANRVSSAEVARCVAAVRELLERAPKNVSTHRAINAWAANAGYSAATLTLAKGVLTATGLARVVIEPNWQYYKVAPKAWQLLPQVHNASPSAVEEAWVRAVGGPRLTRGAEHVAMLAASLLRMLRSTPRGALLRSELVAWAASREKGHTHARSALAALLEQGLVVQRRQKSLLPGVPGCVEMSLVDLSPYMKDFESSSCSSENESSNGESSDGESSDGESSEIIQAGEFEWDADEEAAALEEKHRASMARRSPEEYLQQLAGQPAAAVAACAHNLLKLIREAPATKGVSSDAIDAWAEREGHAGAVVTAAKGILHTTGAARLVLEPHHYTTDTQFKVWHVWGDIAAPKSDLGKTVAVLAEQMLDAARHSPGETLSRSRLKSFQLKGGLRKTEVSEVNWAAALLVEAGVAVMLKPETEGAAASKSRQSVMAAVDLSRYLVDFEWRGGGEEHRQFE